MKTQTITTYNFNELSSEAKKNALEYVRNNWHDLGDFTVNDVIKSLEALAKAVNGKLDYSISIVPDRGEYIRLNDYNEKTLEDLYIRVGVYPLTGLCYDIDVIKGLFNNDLEYRVLKMLHAEGEYIYSNEGLTEFIEANEYQFTNDGEIYKY